MSILRFGEFWGFPKGGHCYTNEQGEHVMDKDKRRLLRKWKTEQPEPLGPVPQHLGNWTQTYSGRQFWPLDPRPSEIFIIDIAHALSQICRFGGHCTRFYSVAEHSFHVSNRVDSQDALWGLLHDASEAYLGDIVRPLKKSWPHYSVQEDQVMTAVCDRYSLVHGMPESVREADNRMLATEADQIMSIPPVIWDSPAEPYKFDLECWSPDIAKKFFLERFLSLV